MVNIFGKWKDKLAHYVDVRVRLMKLTLIEQIANVMSYLIYILLLLFVLLAVFVFLGISLGEFMAEIVHSRSGGYLITSGIFILFIFLLVALRSTITTMFGNLFVGVLTSVKDKDDDIDDDEDDDESEDRS
ncbi:MAG: hypothetical protein EOP51_12955 [Sphingobacteriales bacterium]|nr:MAG: hypothetical protein EOP51_12955 [Sphingobacteriales bacterium]